MFVLEGIGYTFADNRVQALEGINLCLAPGRIHAIIGENGAGKSTLARICTGHLPIGTGRLEVSGDTIHLRNPAQALCAGLALVPQHPSLACDLYVWQNLVLGSLACAGKAHYPGLVRRKDVLRDLNQRLSEWQIHLPLEMPARLLDAAHMHWAAVAEALLAQPRYLFLDEPSAPYSPDDVFRLYNLLCRCADRGMMVAVITHRLQEVLDWADEVHILRHGHLVAEFPIDSRIDIGCLLKPMFGNAAIGPGPEDSGRQETSAISTVAGPDILVLRGLEARDGPGRSLHGLDFIARPGRISGLVGIKDQGLEILEDLLAGVVPARKGSILYGGKPISTLKRQEIGYIPGKRFVRGIATGLTIGDNLISRDRRRLFPWGFTTDRRQRAWRAASAFKIGRSWNQLITTLSGGMIQRLIFERELANPMPRLIICAEPWWGLDLQFQGILISRLRELAKAGATVVVLSSDLNEAMSCCDQVTIIRHGRGVLHQEGPEYDQVSLARAMVHTPEAIL